MKRKLAGDQIAHAVQAPLPLPPRERNGGTDPQSVAEFLALDIDFGVEPAIGVVFPPEVERPEKDR